MEIGTKHIQRDILFRNTCCKLGIWEFLN